MASSMMVVRLLLKAVQTLSSLYVLLCMEKQSLLTPSKPITVMFVKVMAIKCYLLKISSVKLGMIPTLGPLAQELSDS